MNETYKRHVLGFPEMDAQHDYCYRLFDSIKPVAASGDSPKLGKLLREIEMYLMFHFDCEEHLMRMYEFPGFTVHQGDHEQAGGYFIRFLEASQSLKSPVTLTLRALGAQTAKCTPCSPSTAIGCEPSLSYSLKWLPCLSRKMS